MHLAKFVNFFIVMIPGIWIGCNAIVGLSKGEESFCAFLGDKSNCYAEFHRILGDSCGSTIHTEVQGGFATRTMLSSCVLARGGRVEFDPPIDIKNAFPGASAPLSIKLVTSTNEEAGLITYRNEYYWSITLKSLCEPITSDGGMNAPQDRTISVTNLPNQGAMAISCAAQGVNSPSQQAEPETHYFDLGEVLIAEGKNSCSRLSALIPRAVLQLDSGDFDKAGSLQLRIDYPPATFGTSVGENDTTQKIQPDSVFYFDCLIPKAATTCTDGILDESETDTDCGGGEILPHCPARCVEGKFCQIDCDCDPTTLCKVEPQTGNKKCTSPESGETINKGLCSQVACGNKVLDLDETDVDCGGGCPRCELGRTCKVDTDCQSKNCTGGFCESSCDDGIKDGSETDVDCGGFCLPCANNKACNGNSDCGSYNCTNGLCYPQTCTNMVVDGSETALNCGGGSCPPCAEGQKCVVNDDCVSHGCTNYVCSHCANGIKDEKETDVDCGGLAQNSSCAGCAPGKNCAEDSDCTSGNCVMNSCN